MKAIHIYLSIHMSIVLLSVVIVVLLTSAALSAARLKCQRSPLLLLRQKLIGFVKADEMGVGMLACGVCEVPWASVCSGWEVHPGSVE